MFGYIRPAYPELKVRENKLYRAYYCGVCRAMGKCTGQISRLALNYDLVFLSMIRQAVTGEATRVRECRCAVHPLKKRPFCEMGDSLSFCAYCASVLALGKLRDDIRDESGLRRLASRSAHSLLRRSGNKAEEKYPELCRSVSDCLESIREAEERGEADVDLMCGLFGELLGEVSCFGLSGRERTVSRAVGVAVGKFIYLCDAADDAYSDIKSGRYNPLVLSLGKDICEKRTVYGFDLRSREKYVLREDMAQSVLCSASYILRDLSEAVSLIDFTNAPELRGIVENIAHIGMAGQMRYILGLIRVPEQNMKGHSTDEGSI